MPIKKTLSGGHVPVFVYTDDVDAATMDQLKQTAQMPFIHHHIAAMPDVHLGMGATVGSVIPTKGAIIPAAVGVDIGCGMNAIRLSLNARDLPDNLGPTRSAIEAHVPVGFNQHAPVAAPELLWKPLADGLDDILAKHPKIAPRQASKPLTQLGTLGGDNHFIELCLDEEGGVWVMLHSGSRGIGNIIGSYFIQKAKERMHDILGTLPNKDLAFLPQESGLFTDYIDAVFWAQRYARYNRNAMMSAVLDTLQTTLPPFYIKTEVINCHHNYIALERHYDEDVYVTRKGAIRARPDDLGIIPGSMGTKSYIVRGKGSSESFHSCSHGAGRRMSRSQAKREFSLDDFIKQTEGVECRKNHSVIDKIPGAYKDIDQVMANQTDLVDVIHTLKQVICIKG